MTETTTGSASISSDAGFDEADRFAFGRNWRRFLSHVDDEVIERATESLASMLGVETLAGKTFLDAGSGSGLFSLAARKLGADVLSFDLDSESVACAVELKRRYFPDDAQWKIESGSVLDESYLTALGRFDVVYSWGVLHHTGKMWDAIAHVSERVAPEGVLFIAIYNDQGRPSRRWLWIKRLYNRLPRGLRFLVLWPAFLRLWGPTFVRDTLRLRPLSTWREYCKTSRGMNPWRDVVDWVGGYPFEVARPEEIFDFCRQRGFQLSRMTTCGGGLGCNEFVLQKTAD